MKKFNIGDKVKLRDDLTVEEMNKAPYITEEMWGMMRQGQEHKVLEYSLNYVLLEGDEEWSFLPEWLELFEPAVVHDFEVGDLVKMVEPAESFIEATVGKTYKITDALDYSYGIRGDNGNLQYFTKGDYKFGKFIKIEKVELTLDEIAEKFSIPVEQLKIKK